MEFYTEIGLFDTSSKTVLPIEMPVIKQLMEWSLAKFTPALPPLVGKRSHAITTPASFPHHSVPLQPVTTTFCFGMKNEATTLKNARINKMMFTVTQMRYVAQTAS